MGSKLWMIGILLTFQSFAQDQYIIWLKDKGNQTLTDVQLTKKALIRRQKLGTSLHETDIPLSPTYLQTLDRHGQVKLKSKWLNAVVLNTATSSEELMKLSFVDSLVHLNKRSSVKQSAVAAIDGLNYGLAEEDYALMDIPLMHDLGYRGDSLKIAVFDSGFEGVETMDVFSNTTILGGYNFVSGDSNVYQSDIHGTYVFSVIGANQPGKLIGTAFKASFYLFVTEDIGSESLEEEFNWLVAAEKCDSLGVDIISSSLSYTTFDNAAEDHSYQDLDGQTTIISQAAAEAARKGMIVVNSAGNEGNSSWGYVAPPADADSILAVGSVNSFGNYAIYSSRGPTYDGRLKPEVVCQGVNVYVADKSNVITTATGTSFSAPQVTGLCAGVWNLDTSLSNIEVINMVKASASRYSNPDNYYGYGIPSFARLLNNYYNEGQEGVFIRATQLYPNPVQDQRLRLFVEGVNDLGEQASIKMYHSSGILVYEEELKLQEVITPLDADVSILSSGIYFIKVALPSGEYTHQLMKL